MVTHNSRPKVYAETLLIRVRMYVIRIARCPEMTVVRIRNTHNRHTSCIRVKEHSSVNFTCALLSVAKTNVHIRHGIDNLQVSRLAFSVHGT